MIVELAPVERAREAGGIAGACRALKDEPRRLRRDAAVKAELKARAWLDARAVKLRVMRVDRADAGHGALVKARAGREGGLGKDGRDVVVGKLHGKDAACRSLFHIAARSEVAAKRPALDLDARLAQKGRRVRRDGDARFRRVAVR